MLELLNELQGKLNQVETALMFSRATARPDVNDLLAQLDELQMVAGRIREESYKQPQPAPFFVFDNRDDDELGIGVPA